MRQEWNGFKEGRWTTSVNVKNFIQLNYTPYDGDEAFLAPPTAATTALWEKVLKLQQEERDKGGVLDMDTDIVSSITSHEAGYIDKDLEKIVGLQTDKPFKRALQPYGGLRVSENACKASACTAFLPSTAKRTTKAFSMYTHPKCVLPESPALSRGFPMRTAEAVLSGTIAESRYTAWII